MENNVARDMLASRAAKFSKVITFQDSVSLTLSVVATFELHALFILDWHSRKKIMLSQQLQQKPKG